MSTRNRLRALKRRQGGPGKKKGDGFHKLYAEKHALNRAKERFELKLTHADLEDIVKRIEAGEARLLGVHPNKGPLYRLTVRNQTVVVAYTKRHRIIRTFLTEEMAEQTLKGVAKK